MYVLWYIALRATGQLANRKIIRLKNRYNGIIIIIAYHFILLYVRQRVVSVQFVQPALRYSLLVDTSLFVGH